MNGATLKEVKEIFEAIVVPHLDNIKEDVKGLTDKFEKVKDELMAQALKVQSNTTRLDDNDKNFSKSVFLATLVIGTVSIGTNLLIAYLKK